MSERVSVNKVVRALSTVCMRIKCFVPINKSRLGGRRVRYAGERVGENEVWRRGEGEREVD